MFVHSFFLFNIFAVLFKPSFLHVTFREGHAPLNFVAFFTVINSFKDSNYRFTDSAKYNRAPARGGGGRGPISLVWILKRLVSVFVNASRRCLRLNENFLSLSEF